jgi:hypothetical protein
MMGGDVYTNREPKEDPADSEPVRFKWIDIKKKEALTKEEQYQIQEFEKNSKI